MTINEVALKNYLLERERQGHYDELEKPAFVDRIVYTENGVAKLREIEEDEDLDRIYQIAENNLNALREKNVDHINTYHAAFEDYEGKKVLAIFQPYTEKPDSDSDKWSDIIFDSYQEKGLSLDAKLENFGVQLSSSGEEIFYGYRDVSDKASVQASDEEVAREF
ncbi:MAG: hypothetical protein ABEJ72_06500, partial [Candidatus Aenigmatarchaeota archaeon]